MFLLYRSILAIHIIAVISWMAGILYLFRLFVYHAEETEAVVKARFCVMEGRLYRFILVPAMVVTVLAGGGMVALKPELLLQPWLHLKILLVFGLIGMSLYALKILEDLKEGTCRISSKKFRVLNEVPTLLMICIVFLVILRPFA